MDFKKLIQKKMGAGEMLAPMEKDAHKKALLSLRKEATETMKPEFDGLKKVTVASDSPEGLKEGLDVAQEMSGDEKLKGDMFPDAGAYDKDAEATMDEMHMEESGLSDEEKMMDLPTLEHKIQCLLARREELKG